MSASFIGNPDTFGAVPLQAVYEGRLYERFYDGNYGCSICCFINKDRSRNYSPGCDAVRCACNGGHNWRLAPLVDMEVL